GPGMSRLVASATCGGGGPTDYGRRWAFPRATVSRRGRRRRDCRILQSEFWRAAILAFSNPGFGGDGWESNPLRTRLPTVIGPDRPRSLAMLAVILAVGSKGTG